MISCDKWIIIFECMYLFYIFRHFKTSKSFTYDLFIKNQYLQHPRGFYNSKENQICKFGQDAIIVLISILLLPIVFQVSHFWIKASLCIALILSIININALVYLLPVVFIEFCLLGRH